jgi:hypothetical protein
MQKQPPFISLDIQFLHLEVCVEQNRLRSNRVLENVTSMGAKKSAW